MNKILRKLLLVVAMLLPALSVMAYDYDFEDNGMYYLITSDDDLTCAVAPGNKAYAGNVVIPATATFEGATYKVTAIAANAFKDCKRLKSIDLNNNITKIGYYAFSGCTSLTTIDLKNVTEIEYSAFSGCTSLTTIDLKNVNRLGVCAFANCACIESVDLQNITELDGTFYGCSSLKKVEGTQNLKELRTQNVYNYGVFERCSSLTSVDMPNVERVGERIFYNSNLTSIILPNCKTVIIYDYNSNCRTFDSKALTTLAIPNVEGFVGSYSLPASSLTELVLGKSTYLFKSTSNNVLTALSNYECESLKKITFLSAEPQWAQIGSDCFPNADAYVPKGSTAAYIAYKAEHPDCFKNVYEFEPEVKMSESAVTIRLDGRYQLSAMVLPYYDSTNIQWESSNPSIADVSSKGLVFGFSEGNATITAKYGNATATCAIKVSKTESVEDVKVDTATEYDVYNMQGILIRKQCDKASLNDLPKGIYILVSPQSRTKIII